METFFEVEYSYPIMCTEKQSTRKADVKISFFVSSASYLLPTTFF